jgi:hypothetical protein
MEVIMKRMVMLTLGFAALGTLLYSQNGDFRQREQFDYTRNQTAPEQLSLTGILGLHRGIIVLESGEQTWYVPELQRYTGFIEGLKEGATVTLEGWGLKNPQPDENTGFLRISKLTLNGKDYDLEGPGIARSPAPQLDRPPTPPRFDSNGPRDPRRPGPGRDRHHSR